MALERMNVKIALLGCGRIVTRHVLPNLLDCPACTVVSLCDTSKDALHEASQHPSLRGAALFTDWQELLKKGGFDAAIISTPHFLHHPMAVACLSAKRHVLVAKPIALTVAGAGEMIRAAEKNGVILMIEQTQRFDPVHELAKDIIESGRLGKISMIKGRLGHAGPEYWTGGEAGWLVDKEKSGGGTLMDSGAHIIDLLRWLKNSEIASIVCVTETLEKTFGVEDNAVGILAFDDGTLGMIECSWTTRPYDISVKVYGENGTLETRTGSGGSRVTLSIAKSRPSDPNILETVETPAVPAKSKHGSPFHYFIDCIGHGRKPFVAGIDGLRCLEVILAGYRSAKEGKRVAINTTKVT
ncbi:MAG: Gfo/Idh/MocA family oxidoreductase [Candidatus Omnitrophica bacterium]|nr:Gfo/Idh/MocA family oxidoreductase [Candidatus Omnitrophota bacterium]